jgi:hypothetical protein
MITKVHNKNLPGIIFVFSFFFSLPPGLSVTVCRYTFPHSLPVLGDLLLNLCVTSVLGNSPSVLSSF